MGSATSLSASHYKRVKTEVRDDDYDRYDWSALKESGEWKGLTINDLKIYLRKHQLPVSGKRVRQDQSDQGTISRQLIILY